MIWARGGLGLKGPSIADVYDRGEDNFLLLRFLAASLVIYGHSFALCGLPGDGDFVARFGIGEGIYTGSIAVDMFFAISGFLVTASFTNRNNFWQFLRARALRLLPAYFACLLLTAALLGPLFSDLPLRQYFDSAETWDYVLVNSQFGRQLAWNLPGVFVHNFTQSTVNGSIWTLPSEARMYGLVALLGVLSVLRRRAIANVTLIALIAFGNATWHSAPLFDHAAFVHLATMFVGGMLLWINRTSVRLNSALLLILSGLAVVAHATPLFPFAFGACVAYFCLWFAYIPNLYFFNRCGDYSYGLYLWGYPIQQSVAALSGHATSPFFNASASFAVALPLAMLSWHLLEKPALQLKRTSNLRAPELESSV